MDQTLELFGDERLRSIFSAHHVRRLSDIFANNRKLIHYTSAENALNVFRSKEMWMRNVRVMNDLREVTHGVSMVMSALDALKDATTTTIETGLTAVVRELDEIFPGLTASGNEIFHSWRFHIEHLSYVTCLSEHMPDEANIGRLSMWRNYTGQQIGVGVVIDPSPFKNLLDDYGAISSPVQYLDEQGLNAMLHEVAAAIHADAHFLRTADRQDVLGHYFQLLRSLCLATKHPGFKEEREWRIFHTHSMDSGTGLSTAIVSPGGVPQRIMKLEFRNDPDRGISGITLPELIDHVIIGPCQTPLVVGEAIASELVALGIPNGAQRIRYSNIPIRT
ncbi:DUF2971 domain-containing protein [Sinorhizobium medicae]|nr:DUF2971 domain-containing protein [Sinorhizobium medicae]